MAGIYIHIPYCKQACHYCNFHFSTTLQSLPEMLRAILTELTLRQSYLDYQRIETIYFGGGTPSMLTSTSLGSILDQIHKTQTVHGNCEITLEANPDDISIEKLTDWQSLGINRLSLGIQSFHDDDLHFMNRAHTGSQATEALDIILNSGIDRLTADIIFGYQGLTTQKLNYNLNQLTTQSVHHLSCYGLTIEPKTALYHQVKTGLVNPLPEDKAAQQFNLVKLVLQDNGYDHYEISNYARHGEYAIHNTNYWKQKMYMGIGPSAHSFNGKSRQWNVSHNTQYINAIQSNSSFYEEEVLSLTDQYNEYIMTGLRTKWGVNLKHIKSIGDTYAEHFIKETQAFLTSGQLLQDGDIWTIREEDKVLCDAISSQLFFV